MTLSSFDHDFIFLRTRKTASTSTETYLQPVCMPPGRPLEEYSPRPIVSRHGIVGRRLTHRKPSLAFRVEMKIRSKLGLTNWAPHMPAAKVRNALDTATWARSLKLTTVRNPFARQVPAFYFEMGERIAEFADENALIEGFRRMLRKSSCRNDRDIVFIGKDFVPDVLIRQEYLRDDLEALAVRLGLDTSRIALPVTKKTKSSDATTRPPFAAFYDDESADLVRNRLAGVFAHAGYSPEVPA